MIPICKPQESECHHFRDEETKTYNLHNFIMTTQNENVKALVQIPVGVSACLEISHTLPSNMVHILISLRRLALPVICLFISIQSS